jgi:hypothetical protein
VRNQLVEQQFVDATQLHRISEAAGNLGPNGSMSLKDANGNIIHEVGTSRASSLGPDSIIERTLGIFVDAADLGQSPHVASIQCCTGNGAQALYFAWDGIVRPQSDGAVQVNLLLNRASPWMDIWSYLPYEGKVILNNRTATSLSLRVPSWVDRRALRCTISGKDRKLAWVGNYVVIGDLKAGNEIVVAFPVPEEQAQYVVLTKQQWTCDPRPDKNPPASDIRYICTFRGSTLVDFSPRPDDRWYLTYQRDHLKANRAPMKRVQRYVAPM